MGLTPLEQARYDELRLKELKEKEAASLPKTDGPAFEAAERPWYDVSGKGLLKASLETLPTAGAALGGIGGGALGFLGGLGYGAIPGSIVGAGWGGAMGKTLENLGEHYLLDEPKLREDIYGDPIRAIPEGMKQEMFGQVLSAVPGHVAAQRAENARAIEEASKRLDIKPTPGMTADKSGGYALRGLESSLEQQPTLAGKMVREETDLAKSKLGQSVEGLLEESSSLSPYQSGEKIKSGIFKNLEEKYTPIKESYKQIRESTPFIDLDQKSLQRVAKSIRNINEAKFVPSSPSFRTADDFAKSLEGLKTVDDLANLQSTAKAILRDENADILTKQTASQIVDKLDRLQQSSIMRGAIQSARTSGEGLEAGKGLIGQIKETNKAYRELKTKASEFGEKTGLVKSSKTDRGLETFKQELESVPSEKITEKLFNTGDINTLKYLKENNPKAFEVARQQKLAEIEKASLHTDGSISTKKFLNNVKKLGPEAKEMLFGTKAPTLEDIQTVTYSLPEKIGASDTPRGMMFSQTWDPLSQVKGLLQYGQYKAMGSPLMQKLAEQKQLYTPMAGVAGYEGTPSVIGVKEFFNPRKKGEK